MTAAQIAVEVRRRLIVPVNNAALGQAIVIACDHVLQNRTLPGDSWVDQIVLETVRIVKEPRPASRERTSMELFYATREKASVMAARASTVPEPEPLNLFPNEGTMKERTVVTAEFVKILALGTSVAGRVTRHDKNDNGSFIIMEPVFVQRPGGPWARFGSAAVGLSTDLRRKVTEADVGKALMLTYHATSPSDKGSPQKLFKVFEMDGEEIKGLADQAPDFAAAGTKLNPGGESDDDDDLPF